VISSFELEPQPEALRNINNNAPAANDGGPDPNGEKMTKLE